MRTLTKTKMTIVAALILAMTASMMFATAPAAFGDTQVSSARVTQSTEDGLEVECEGNLKCEIIGDDTVVATSEDSTTSTTITTATATTTLNATTLDQSDITEFNNDFNIIDDDQDLGARIEGMVDRLLDEISANLAKLAIFI